MGNTKMVRNVVSGMVRIGIDVGGTFTDLFLLDESSGRTVRHKLSSTPDDPYKAPIQGILEVLQKANIGAQQVGFVGLGTTVATNALIERKGAITGLLTTKGFRDVLEIGRQSRPHTYNLLARKPKPLVPRELRLEVDERIGADGSIITPLSEADVNDVVIQLVNKGVTSIAICFINSYANPVHEKRVVEIIRKNWPEIEITSSQELMPEFREYERLSSTVINAYLMSVMKRYLTRFSEEVRALGVPDMPFVMTSGGGIASPALASERPIDTLLSGPSGGVSGALFQAQLCGFSDIITFDMGGTSTDVSLIQKANPEVTHSRRVDGLPIRSTAIDIQAVGAGGSSIAWIDAGNLLRVGPQSAGAKPGPACYGIEGAQPTVTDANVVLGRLSQKYLLDGALKIDASKSIRAIEESIAKPKGLNVHQAAAAILAVSTTTIAQAIRIVSVQRGLDPSEFVLVAFGGAGPLHAAAVARELKMTVLIPPMPGVLCAMGVLTKDVQLETSQTRLVRASESTAIDQITRIYTELEERAIKGLSLGRKSDIVIERSVEARYAGQSFELRVPVPTGTIAVTSMHAIRDGFGAVYKRLYGYDRPGEEIELVTFRVKALSPVQRPNLSREPRPSRERVTQSETTRKAYFETIQDFLECPLLRRENLEQGSTIEGPAIIEQMDTTTIVPPDFVAITLESGNLILQLKQNGGARK